MNITVETIPHENHRYPTCGDWILTPAPKKGDSELKILVSETGDWRMNMAIAVHEIVEALLCVEHGIPQERVDEFDKQFEEMYDTDPSKFITDEPGEIPVAPYYAEHMAATVVERLFAWQIGLSWPAYEKRVAELMDRK